MAVSIKIAGANFTKYVATMLQAIRLLARSGAAETFVDANYRYTFTPPGTNKFLNMATMTLPASTDGHMSMKVSMSVAGATTTNPVLIASPTRDAINYNATGRYSVYVGLGGVIRVTENGAANITCNVVPGFVFVDGALLRLRRAGANWFAEISTNDGASFTLLHNFGSTSAAAMFPVFQNVGGTSSESMLLRFFGSAEMIGV